MSFTAPHHFTSDWLADVVGIDSIDRDGRTVVVTGTGALLARVATALAVHETAPDDLTVERTSLEDAFLTITEPSTQLTAS